MMKPSLLVLVSLVTLFLYARYARLRTKKRSVEEWFRHEASSFSPSEVRSWSEEMKDKKLHHLSGWSYASATTWIRYVQNTVFPLGILAGERFRFLEVGCGVGVFSRVLFKIFPHASGFGFDIEPRAISIARAVLPAERFDLIVSNMSSFIVTEKAFDYIFIPGALCYLESLDLIEHTVRSLLKGLKCGGRGMCASMLPGVASKMGSCRSRVPESFWFALGVTVIKMEDMAKWKSKDTIYHRYNVCVRKHCP
jgi:SAM-dependent methyltransferase